MGKRGGGEREGGEVRIVKGGEGKRGGKEERREEKERGEKEERKEKE